MVSIRSSIFCSVFTGLDRISRYKLTSDAITSQSSHPARFDIFTLMYILVAISIVATSVVDHAAARN